MAGFKNHITLLLILLAVTAKAQSTESISNVKQIYVLLQDKNASLQDLYVIAPAVNWDKIKAGKEKDSRRRIELSGLLKNKWVSLVISDLEYDSSTKDILVVTGMAKGRNATECEYVYSGFKHSWVLKNGEIIEFQE